MADVKPDAGNGGGETATITLRVKDQTGEETLFKARTLCVCVWGEGSGKRWRRWAAQCVRA